MYNLTLNQMNYSDDSFKGPYENTVSYEKYQYTFTSNHKLTIFTLTSDRWMGTFKNLNNDKSGELSCAGDANSVLNQFLNLLNNNSIREDIMEGFKF